MSKDSKSEKAVPGELTAANFPPALSSPYVFTGRTVRIQSEQEFRQIPKNAVRLTRREVIAAADRFKQRKEFREYEALEEWWPVTSGFACAVTSIYVISIVRHKFKLGRYHARAIHYVSGSVFPVVFVPIASIPFVHEPALIKEYSCADCLGIRSGMVQWAGGVVWASAIAVIGAMYYAKRYATVPLPPFSRRYIKDYRKIISQPFAPIMPYLLGHSLVQFGVGYVGGIKFWYRGQEMNAVDNYMALKSMNIGGNEVVPQFVKEKVNTDWVTEKIATGGDLGQLLGLAVAKDDSSDEKDNKSLVARFNYYIRSWYRYLFGKSGNEAENDYSTVAKD